MLELVGVVVKDQGRTRLSRLDLTARPGEIVGVVGLTGSGKSTTLQVAAGIRPPDRGRIVYEGRDVTRQPGRLRAATGWMGHTLEGPVELTARRWLKLWASMEAVAADLTRTRIAEASEQLGLEDLLDQPVRDLSRGEARRLALARLWVRQPQMYLLDGPEEGVDGPGLRQISTAIRAASAAGATILCACANPYFPQAICDRVICLTDGAATDEISRGAPDFSDRLADALGWLR